SARYVWRIIFLTLSTSTINSICFFRRSITHTPIKKKPSHPTRITPFSSDPTVLVRCIRFSSEKLKSPIINPYTESREAKRQIPPAIKPYRPFRPNVVSTAAEKRIRDAAAIPTDSLPFAASFLFIMEYLYLFAIMFSPQIIADGKHKIAQRRPQRIQDHIVHIKSTDFRNKLATLHAQTQ